MVCLYSTQTRNTRTAAKVNNSAILLPLLHLVFGIDGRALLHQQLDARQVASISSQVERGTTELRSNKKRQEKTDVPKQETKVSTHVKINIYFKKRNN